MFQKAGLCEKSANFNNELGEPFFIPEKELHLQSKLCNSHCKSVLLAKCTNLYKQFFFVFVLEFGHGDLQHLVCTLLHTVKLCIWCHQVVLESTQGFLATSSNIWWQLLITSFFILFCSVAIVPLTLNLRIMLPTVSLGTFSVFATFVYPFNQMNKAMFSSLIFWDNYLDLIIFYMQSNVTMNNSQASLGFFVLSQVLLVTLMKRLISDVRWIWDKSWFAKESSDVGF